MDVNLAEEGILQLLFVSVHQICSSVGRDTDLALVSRYAFFSISMQLFLFRKLGVL